MRLAFQYLNATHSQNIWDEMVDPTVRCVINGNLEVYSLAVSVSAGWYLSRKANRSLSVFELGSCLVGYRSLVNRKHVEMRANPFVVNNVTGIYS